MTRKGRHQNQDSCENQEKLSVITPAAHTGGRTAQIMAGPAQSARHNVASYIFPIAIDIYLHVICNLADSINHQLEKLEAAKAA